MPIVEIPGVGEIEFPENMSQSEIENVLRKQFPPQQMAAPAPQVQFSPTSPQMADPMAESMAMFSPAAAGEGAKMFAPEIGATAGGVVGSMIPIPGATPFMTGLGYAGGEAIKRGGDFPASPRDVNFDQLAQDFGKGAAMELAVKPISWLASKAFEPIKQGFQMLRAGQLMDKGLPIPASAVSPSEKGLTLAKKARETYPGNKIVQEAHEKLRTGVDDMVKELSAKYNLYEHNPKGIADQAFDAWAEAMGGNNAPIQLNNAIAKIREVLTDPIVVNAAPKDKKALWWKQQAASFADNPTLQGLRDIWATITSKGGGTDRTKRNELLQAIQSDLEANYGDEIVNLLNQARDKNAWAKKANILKGIIDMSKSKEGGLQFNPDVFAYEWQKVIGSPKVRSFTRQELAELTEFSEMLGVVGNELKQNVSQKGIESLMTTAGGATILGAGLSHLTGIPSTAAVAALPGIRALLSRQAGQIYKPGSRIYQNMLGEPNARELIPGLVNIGGKLVLIEGEQWLQD